MVYFIFGIPVPAPCMSILRFLRESVSSLIDFCPLVRLFQTFFPDHVSGWLPGALVGSALAVGGFCVRVLVPRGHGTPRCSVSSVPAAASHPAGAPGKRLRMQEAFCQMHGAASMVPGSAELQFWGRGGDLQSASWSVELGECSAPLLHP